MKFRAQLPHDLYRSRIITLKSTLPVAKVLASPPTSPTIGFCDVFVYFSQLRLTALFCAFILNIHRLVAFTLHTRPRDSKFRHFPVFQTLFVKSLPSKFLYVGNQSLCK
jgi:hypothetical protein